MCENPSKELLLLVGGIPTPLKNMKVTWDYEIPNIWKIKNVPNHQSDYDLLGSVDC